MSIHSLIDADLVAFRCAATCEEFDTPDIAIIRCNNLTEQIIDAVNANSYTLFLSGSDNFRKTINPQYKANRKDKPRPKWLQACREFLVTEWQAVVTDGIEADDAMGIHQTEDSIICSLDKDMLQVPGWHYNWVKDQATFVTPEEGLKSFWTQMIVGDVADNVFGIKGLGPVKAARILDPIEGDTYDELYTNYHGTVSNLYNDPDRFSSNAKCLWIQRTPGGVWLSPGEQAVEPSEITESIEVDLNTPSQNCLPQTD